MLPIVHLAPTSFGRDGLWGGGERYPLELAKATARHHPCKLITFGPHRSRTHSADLEIVILPTIMHMRGHPAHPVGRGLLRELRGSRLIHAHQLRAMPTRIAAVLAKTTRTPLVVTDHGLGGGSWGGLLPKLFDRFLVVSGASARYLDAPPDRTDVIFGGVDADRFTPCKEARHGVLFVGRITPHKGIDILLRALPEGAALTIAGTTGHDAREPQVTYPDLVQSLAVGRDVTFEFDASEDRLPRLYARAQAFVLPSVERTVYGDRVEISELLGLSVLEAMASGTPVVCSRIGGIPEIVRHGVTGLLFEPGNVNELRSCLHAVLSDRHLAARLGEAARSWVEKQLTWEHCAQRCLRAYESLLSE